MDPTLVLKFLSAGQIVFPALVNVVTHYSALKDDPALSETDKAQMIRNLQALQLKSWEEL